MKSHCICISVLYLVEKVIVTDKLCHFRDTEFEVVTAWPSFDIDTYK